MAGSLETRIKIGVDADGVRPQLDEVAGAIQNVGEAGQAATAPLDGTATAAGELGNASGQAAQQTGELAGKLNEAGTSSGTLGGLFDSLAGKIAAVGAAAAAAFAAGLVGNSVKSATDLQTQMLKLEGVIQATGGTAGFTAGEIDALARKLDEATLGSAAGFRDAAAQLMTFRTISGETFERTLALSQDLASVMGGDVTGAAMQLGKALEDPVNGLSALRRSGVSFTQEQQELIKSLHESGRAAEAQGLILDEVGKQVGGVASHMGSGLAGALDLVGKRWTDIKETLGNALLPALTELANKIAAAMKAAQDSGAIEALGTVFATVANNADKLAVILAVGLGIKAVAALRAYAAASTTAAHAANAHAAAASRQAFALNPLAATGKLASGALIGLTQATVGTTGAILAKVRALGLLRMAMIGTGIGALVVGVGMLAGKFIESRDAAEALERKAVETQEAVQRLVQDAFVAGSVDAVAAVDDIRTGLEGLELDGEARMTALGDAITQAVTRTDSIAGLLALKAKILELGESGDISLGKMHVALEAVEKRLAQMPAAVEEPSRRLSELLRAAADEGKSSADALQAAFQQVDISSVDGVAELMTDLDAIQQRAGATGAELQAQLGERLKSLSANELAEFATMAEMAFTRIEGKTESLALINDAVLAASFAKLGLVAEKELGRVTPAAQEAIGALDGIRSSLEKTSADAETRMTALGSAVSAALSRADTIEAVELLIAKIEEMGETGELAGERYTDALEAARQKLQDLKKEIDPVENAFKALGIKSSAELKRLADEAHGHFQKIKNSGTATTEDLKNAFTVYAERAVKANGGVVSEALKTEAQMNGLKLTTDETGKVIVEAMNAGARAAGELKGAVGEVREEMTGLQKEAQETQDLFDKWRQDTAKSRQGSGPVAAADFSDLLSQAESAGGAALRERLEAQLRSWMAASNMASVQGTYNPGIGSADDLRKAMQAAIIAAEKDAARRSDRDGARTRTGSQSTGTNPMATATPFGTININLGARSYRIPTTADGAREVEAMMRAIEADARLLP